MVGKRSLPTLRRLQCPPGDMSDSIDAFIDALWLEEGLSRNTLSAYRRDLELYEKWLVPRGLRLPATSEADLHGYFAARHAETKATSSNAERNTGLIVR